MEYRAVYSGDYISHGKFKYIDKWKSKTGKWVYKYADQLNSAAKSLKPNTAFNTVGFGGTVFGTHIGVKPSNQSNHTNHSVPNQNASAKRKKMRSGNNSPGGWHKSSDSESLKGYDQTRTRYFQNEKGQTIRRTEYRSTGQNKNLNRRVYENNAMYRQARGPVIGAIMDLNDKYGPKRVDLIANYDSEGRMFVEEQLVNKIGNRVVSSEMYTFRPSEDRVVKKKKVKKNRPGPGVKPRRKG